MFGRFAIEDGQSNAVLLSGHASSALSALYGLSKTNLDLRIKPSIGEL